jgi:hypothetical protein
VFRNVEAEVTLVQAPSTVVGGTFRLSLPNSAPGSYTPWLSFDSSTADVSDALKTLAPDLGTIGVWRWDDVYDGSDWIFHFWNHRGDVLDVIQMDTSRLSGGNGGAITAATEVKRNGTTGERFYGPIAGDWLRTAELKPQVHKLDPNFGCIGG